MGKTTKLSRHVAAIAAEFYTLKKKKKTDVLVATFYTHDDDDVASKRLEAEALRGGKKRERKLQL